MAIIRDDNEFKNKNVIPGGGASQLGGGYSSGGGSATGPAAGNVPKSSWTNIQEYLGNAGQGMETAQGMSGEVETQGMDVQKGIQGWESDVGNQIIGSTPQFGETAYNDVASGKSTAAPGTYAGAGGITDATKTAGYGDLQNSVTSLNEKNKQLGDWSGIQGYLKGTVKGPYSQGMSNYDTLLAKTSGGDLMGRTKAKYGQTGNQLKTATSNLGTAIQGAQDKSALVNKSWEDATAANTARLKTISDTKAQEDALKSLNESIAKQNQQPTHNYGQITATPTQEWNPDWSSSDKRAFLEDQANKGKDTTVADFLAGRPNKITAATPKKTVTPYKRA